MPVDPSSFRKLNVIDTCAIWNVPSSRMLYSASVTAGCVFSCTGFVLYESLHKPRKEMSREDEELMSRLEREMRQGRFSVSHLSLEDLADLEILEQRKRLGKGELSAIVHARKTQQAFMTDDQGARKLAAQFMGVRMVQTTPHLLGWLFFTGGLLDGDKSVVIGEHESLNGELSKYFEEIYHRALRYRLLSRSGDETEQG